MSIGPNRLQSYPPEGRLHHGVKQVVKRQSRFPRVSEEIVQGIDLESNPDFQDLLRRVRRRGEQCTLEELMIVADYYNQKYQARLNQVRAQYPIDNPLPNLPLIDLVFKQIHKRYTSTKQQQAENASLHEQTQALNAEIFRLSDADEKYPLVSDILRRYHRSPKLGRYEKGSEEAMIEELLVMTGEISKHYKSNFVDLITDYFEELRRLLYITSDDLVRIKALRHKLNGAVTVIKHTTQRVNALKKIHTTSGNPLDARIDVPMRFLLWKYKPYKKQLYALFSHCQQRKHFKPDADIRPYIQQAGIPIHPAHIRMLENMIGRKSFWDIWHTYRYFDMDRYQFDQGTQEVLSGYARQREEETVLEVDCAIDYLHDRVKQMNRARKKEIQKGDRECLDREMVFDLLKSPRSIELKSYGLLPSDIEAYYRVVDGLPEIEWSYLETFLTTFRDALIRYSRTDAVDCACEKLNATYNLRMSEQERDQWRTYGMSLRTISPR